MTRMALKRPLRNVEARNSDAVVVLPELPFLEKYTNLVIFIR